MIIIPAIDIINGKCVRLTRGDYSQIKKYSSNPVKIAQNFKSAGASFLHIIDLDGAKIGYPKNEKTIMNISKTTGLPIQIGGGIRNFKQASKFLDSGVNKIILGTSALKEKNLIKKLLKKYGSEKIIIAVDVKNRQLMCKGWKEKENISLNNFIDSLKQLGIKYLLVTDIERDGTLTQPNYNLMKEVSKYGFKIIAAGGITTIEQIKKLDKIGIFAVVLGKTLYEGIIDLPKTITYFSPNNLTKRIIPCLDIKDGQVVKGTNFKNLVNIGDAVTLGKMYSQMEADELVFLDITASSEKRKTLSKLVKNIAKNINIPFTVGGGINSLNDVKKLLNAGADKISIGTAAVKNSELIKRIAKKFGSQCLVISVDAKKYNRSWKVYIKGGKEKTNIDAINFAQKMEKMGAGELLVNSLDRDGTKTGFDIELLKKISESVNIPVIASSGAGSKKDFLQVFKKTKVDAVLAASVFHTKKITIKQLKKYLLKSGLKIRI